MWIQGKLLDPIVENLNFGLFGGPKWPKNLGLWDLFFTNLQKYLQWAWKSSLTGIQWKVVTKIVENIDFDPFWPNLGPKMARKFGPQGPFFSHTCKYLQSIYKPNFSVPYKKLLKKCQKTSKNTNFYLFFVIKRIEADIQNSNSTVLWAILLCTC